MLEEIQRTHCDPPVVLNGNQVRRRSNSNLNVDFKVLSAKSCSHRGGGHAVGTRHYAVWQVVGTLQKMSKSLSILCTNCMVRGGPHREILKICHIFILNAKKFDKHEAKTPISEEFCYLRVRKNFSQSRRKLPLISKK